MAKMTVARLVADPAWPRLKAWVIGWTGLAYYGDKDAALADCVARRFDERPDLDLASYVSRLEGEGGNGPETEGLIAEVTIGETYFFRSRDQFEALSTVVVPDLVGRRVRERRLAVWIAGCSNGAEPYSLSILLHSHPLLLGWDISLICSDIDSAALEEARAGVYGRWSLRGLEPHAIADWFEVTGRGWGIKDVYRRGTSFIRHNLFADPPPGSDFDLVLCRNVLMYFDAPSRRLVLEGLRRSMTEGAWLLVGESEAGLEIGNVFVSALIDKSTTLYRKEGSQAPPMRTLPARQAVVPAAVRKRDPSGPAPMAQGLGERAIHLLDQGAWREAESLCRSWTAGSPADPSAYYHLGLALEHLSESEAAAAFRRTLYLDPAFGLAHFHLARIYRSQGQEMLARRHLWKVLDSMASVLPEQPVAGGGGMTAAELTEMAQLCMPPGAAP